MIIGIVACSSEKMPEPADVRRLYISPLFRMSLAVAERDCERVYVASAKHGLLELHERIEPYDLKLDKMPMPARILWGCRLVIQLVGKLGAERCTVNLYAGQSYVEPIVQAARPLRMHIVEPMKGLQIGERLSWLTKQLADRDAPQVVETT